MSFQRFDSVPDYVELQAYIDGLAQSGQHSLWEATVRWYGENDLFYLLNFILTKGTEVNTQTGEPLFLHPYYLDACRTTEWQWENGGGIDSSARRKGKSTYRTYAKTIQRILKYPNSSGAIVSFERKAAKKHARPIILELEQNKLLKTVWSDVLWDDPRQAARDGLTVWSFDDGWTVQRQIVRNTATLEVNCFLNGTPTGGGFDCIDFDDIEDYDVIKNEDQLALLHEEYDKWRPLATPTVLRRTVIMVTNNEYHDKGLVARLSRQAVEMAPANDPRRVMCSPGEDLSEPGDGPMGGTAVYPYSTEWLHDIYNATETKEIYAAQIACSHRAGDTRKFAVQALGVYEQDPYAWARGKNGYLLIDPSRGVKDPTVILGIAAGWDKRLAIVFGAMGWWDPAMPEFDEEVYRAACIMSGICARLVQVRVEDQGQSNFSGQIANHFYRVGFHVPVARCDSSARPTGTYLGKNTGKRQREYERLAGPIARSEILIPKPNQPCIHLAGLHGGPGIMITTKWGKGGKERTFDLVTYFVDRELALYPKPETDNIMDTLGLLYEDPNRVVDIYVGGGKQTRALGPVLYPNFEQPDDDDDEPRNHHRRRPRNGRASWMSA